MKDACVQIDAMEIETAFFSAVWQHMFLKLVVAKLQTVREAQLAIMSQKYILVHGHICILPLQLA